MLLKILIKLFINFLKKEIIAKINQYFYDMLYTYSQYLVLIALSFI